MQLTPRYKSWVLLALSAGLAACGSDNDSSSSNEVPDIDQPHYVAQLVAPDYSSSQLAMGAVNGDRSATQGLLVKDQSDFGFSTYKGTLYHLGRFEIDTVSRYDSGDLSTARWTYSSRQAGEQASANTYQLIQRSADEGYLIRYGSPLVLKVNPQATQADEFIVASIDLSAYAPEDTDTPRMHQAVIDGDRLFVSMQRLDANWSAQTAYIAVIDLDTLTELDTDPQTTGLAGIALEGSNPGSLALHNGRLYVSSRGDYGSDSGALEVIDTTTYQRTTLADGTTFAQLNENLQDDDASNDVIYHIRDVAIASDQLGFALLSLEQGYNAVSSQVMPFNPQTGTFQTALQQSAPALTDLQLNDIEVGPEGRLWLSVSDASAPGLYVVDQDTLTINGDFIELDMPAAKIGFLSN